MVKQKHHTARNQTFKWHRNGIKKAPRTKFIKLMGVSHRARAPPPAAARERPARPLTLPSPRPSAHAPTTQPPTAQARETFKRRSDPKYSLEWGRRLGFAKMAVDQGVTIVPVSSVGTEDMTRIFYDLYVRIPPPACPRT